MTNYGLVFDQKQYMAISKRAAQYFEELDKSVNIPVILTDVPNALEYRYVEFLETSDSYATIEYDENSEGMQTIHSYTDIQLYTQMCHIFIPKSQIRQFGATLIADKQKAKLRKWAVNIDDSNFHGPKNQYGIQLAEGLIGQLTSLQNLNGTDSNLAIKGYIWKAIIKMMNQIPFRIRESAPDMILFVSSNLYEKLISPDRVYVGSVTELEFIMTFLMGEKARKGFKIQNLVVTDKILAEASDDTDGDNSDTADTQGTHDRMLLIVPDPDGVARIQSAGMHLEGEGRSDIGNVRQHWGYRGRGAILDSNFAVYTEALVWA